MWILHFLPDTLILWFCNILLLTGVALTVAGLYAHRIPVVWQYQLPFKVLGIALLTLGVYFRGGYAVEAEWRERVQTVEARLAAAEQAGAEATARLEKKSQEKVRVIQGQQVVVKQYIDRVVKRYDSSCVIPSEFVKAHNDSAERAK